jgi:hypothetical protein
MPFRVRAPCRAHREMRAEHMAEDVATAAPSTKFTPSLIKAQRECNVRDAFRGRAHRGASRPNIRAVMARRCAFCLHRSRPDRGQRLLRGQQWRRALARLPADTRRAGSIGLTGSKLL